MGCFAGFLVGKAAANAMTPRGRGTIIFTGAGQLARALGLRSLLRSRGGIAHAESEQGSSAPPGSMSRMVIDGGIDGERLRSRSLIAQWEAMTRNFNIGALAEAYWQVYRQHRSAWTQELDLPPQGDLLADGGPWRRLGTADASPGFQSGP